MSKLYEINAEIARLTNMVEYNAEVGGFVDLDTGEIMSEEELDGLFSGLEMEKKDILIWLAKETLNLRAEADALKAEEKRLKERRERFERKADRFEAIIDRECAGETTELDVATMRYRKTKAVVISDPAAAIKWLQENGHEECLKIADPEVRKTESKKLMDSGVEIPGMEIEQRLSHTLK